METNGNVKGGGNTSTPPKRIVPSKKWCFTLNNWTEEELGNLETKFHGDMYIIGKEVGASGTKHLQGYVEFASKKRPAEAIGIKRIHWEKAKGDRESNLKYCSKDGDYKTNFEMEDEADEPLKGLVLHEYQKEVLALMETKPDTRTVHWYWEPKGKTGKSALCKHICMHYNAMKVGGKSSDILYGVAERLGSKRKVHAVFINLSRHREEHFNYEALEDLKDGHFYSGKYESKEIKMNSPHVVVFANWPPDRAGLSEDRWNIKRIELPTA